MSDHRMRKDRTRDSTYEMWHRPASLKRFMHEGVARALKNLDIDNPPVPNVFVCGVCWHPIAIAEDTSIPINTKTTTVTYNITYRECGKCGTILVDIPAYVIRFWPSDTPNPTAPEFPDIDRFEVQSLELIDSETPFEGPYIQSPAEHAMWLVLLHVKHLDLHCPAMNQGFLDRFTHELYEKETSILRAAVGH